MNHLLEMQTYCDGMPEHEMLAQSFNNYKQDRKFDKKNGEDSGMVK